MHGIPAPDRGDALDQVKRQVEHLAVEEEQRADSGGVATLLGGPCVIATSAKTMMHELLSHLYARVCPSIAATHRGEDCLAWEAPFAIDVERVDRDGSVEQYRIVLPGRSRK